ncbi:Undecaprenyl phosphate-alpha-4-amino-4-deoxy-L-arabinose arabinosyl transferase [Aquisphaera giovannonii]|uniref:Undecaprenyl phosphate-alpha-4-amino-4-deoxy-L-arabinose arabinosyl transferase n=1 Tax=Aquisphaera giovannonii TaxID=406548 RepID=A0A5B9WH55_9BACT|nr:glycosyltransferase family 39 protein [Aquisphaera giovannonii]QEH39170.1 Undecaprenyl phosphate-alpha-4-amino-4-deoxy-L-arabinose arabinosyl transferase [Aquisphaera giovannonii]
MRSDATTRGRLGGWGLAWLATLTALAVGPGLGSSSRLTYHEAFVAQGAREILDSGSWWEPRIGGLPWLEKPPLPFWLVAAAGACRGEVDATVARLPSAVAAFGLVLGVALLASRRYGRTVGLLAGSIQATTAWTVLRARLAEADLLLAALVTWSLLAFDGMRDGDGSGEEIEGGGNLSRLRDWRLAFFGFLAMTALVKGPGFGAALVLSAAAGVLAWDRDRRAAGRLRSRPGWIVAAAVAAAWPLAMVARHGPGVAWLWILHVAGRFGGGGAHGPFAGESWRDYALNVLAQALPWTPLAAIGAWRSLGRALRGDRGDRLLWCWAALPLGLVSVASARNAHYAIHAMVPWSVWSACGLLRVAGRLADRGWPRPRLVRAAALGLPGLAVSWGLGFWLLGPWLDRRGAEWAFYESAGRAVGASEPVAFLYDDWDRDPYPTPFGPIPHDLAVRLFYLRRPATWHFDPAGLAEVVDRPASPGAGEQPSAVLIARDRDLPALRALGRVEVLERDAGVRWDRTYLLARLRPIAEPPAIPALGAAGADSVRR